MTLASMTGFARTSGGDDEVSWAWEIRSVNGKSLDMRLRIPPGWERLDPKIRALVQKKLKRGNLSLNLDIRAKTAQTAVQVNEEFLETLAAMCKARGEEPRYDRLLTVRGVVEPVDERGNLAEDDSRLAAIQASLEEALDGLVAMRRTEGARISEVLAARIDEIEAFSRQAEQLSSLQPDALAQRLKEQVQALLDESPALSEERLSQEAAVLATKADVREELDRLSAHVSAARDLLAAKGAVGRKLDFLCQEFNRETNTLCSKSSDIELTRIGLGLKAAIDQFREQAANIE